MTRRQRIISFCIAMIGVLIILAILLGRTDKEDTFTPQPEEYTPTERRTEENSEEEGKKLAFAVDTHSISESARLSTHIFNLASERGNIFNPEDFDGIAEPAEKAVANIAYQKYLARLEAQRRAQEQAERQKQESKPVETVPVEVVEDAVEETVTVEDSVETVVEDTQSVEDTSTEAYVSPKDFKWMGTCHYNGWKWTYYSQRVLPGGGLSIPGRHVDSDGFVCDENGYIVLASTVAQDKKDVAVYWTPFGRWGKVYDFCDGVSEATLDVYCDW